MKISRHKKRGIRLEWEKKQKQLDEIEEDIDGGGVR